MRGLTPYMDGELFELVFSDHGETSMLLPCYLRFCHFHADVAAEQFLVEVLRVRRHRRPHLPEAQRVLPRPD